MNDPLPHTHSHTHTHTHTHSDTYVTNESGTGVVHQAPGFGEDDFRVSLKYGILKKGETVVCPVDASGRFTDEVTDFKGKYVKVCCVPAHCTRVSLCLHALSILHGVQLLVQCT